MPPSAQQRDKLAPGDRVLIYVGAPDRIFLGHAIVAAGYHPWSQDEAARYQMASTFDHGISLAEVNIWSKPLPLGAAWPQTQGAKTNPKALWYGAIVTLAAADAELILSAAKDNASSTPTVPAPSAKAPNPPTAMTPADPNPDSEALFAVGERLKKFLADPKTINEDGTRAFFIDKILDALGYSGFDDLEHGASQASGAFPDYILRANGHRVMAVEAKRLGAALGDKEAAQLVSYCTVVGVRW